MGRRARIVSLALLCAVALVALPSTAPAQSSGAPNTDWSALLPPDPSTPTEPQPGSVEHCRRPSVACVDGVITRLQRLRNRLGCDHRGVFATTYLELTKTLRRSFDSDPELFEYPDYIYTQDALFANVYFDAVHGWRQREEVAPAWRIAFEQAERGEITGAQEMLLGINAHVQNDMPFVVAALGVRTRDGASRKPDHDAMNEVLNSAYEHVVREVRARYDPSMSLTNPDQTIADDVGGLELAREWRELVWRNAERLLNASSEAERERVAEEIELNAEYWARAIAATQSPGIRASRDAYCAINFTP
jgi:Family of unknown function (DUF5995)